MELISAPYQASTFFAESLLGYHGLLYVLAALVFRAPSCHRFGVRNVMVLCLLGAAPLLSALACGRGTLDLRGSLLELEAPDAAPAARDAASPEPTPEVDAGAEDSQLTSELYPPPDDFRPPPDDDDDQLDDDVDDPDDTATEPFPSGDAGDFQVILCSEERPFCPYDLLCNYQGVCVQCLSDNQCVEGLVCNYLGYCSPGCRSDRDCGPGRVCNEIELCVGQRCRYDDDCPGFMMCLDGACENYPPPMPEPSTDTDPFDDPASGGAMNPDFPPPVASESPMDGWGGAGGMAAMSAGAAGSAVGGAAGSAAGGAAGWPDFGPVNGELDASVSDASL